VSWFRIILDEAHLIKDRSTSTAKAVFNLVSLNKWCLTGTPLQNRVGELYSLIRFLRVDPHAYYYCRGKGCSCKSLHYRFTQSKCDDCGHSVVQHYCHFNKHILNPIKRSGFVSEGRKAMLKLKQQVTHILQYLSCLYSNLVVSLCLCGLSSPPHSILIRFRRCFLLAIVTAFVA
jgi:DNA repair protein RAD16